MIQRVPLQDVARIERDIVESSAIKAGTMFVGLENIESGGRIVNVRPVDSGELASSKFAFTTRHVLYAKLRPYLAKIARPDFAGICSTDILPLLPGPKLDRNYLAWILLAPEMVSLAASRATGANLPRLSPNALAELTIPLPALYEQRRIAEILDKADALRMKRRAALALLDNLSQSIFLDMFGDPVTNPKGWRVVSIADVCEVKGGKRLPKGDEYSTVKTPFRYIRVTDLRAGRVDESNLVYLKPETQGKIARYIVQTGDVIISIAGSIGLVAPVPERLNGVNLTENAAKLVPRSSSAYLAEYLSKCLQMASVQGQIGAHIGRVTIGKLALFRIEQLKVPLPDINLQREFVRKIANVNSLADAQHESGELMRELFASIQRRSFEGQVG